MKRGRGRPHDNTLRSSSTEATSRAEARRLSIMEPPLRSPHVRWSINANSNMMMMMMMTMIAAVIMTNLMMLHTKVLSTQPHTQKLQYYGAAKTPYSSKLDTLPTGQVRWWWWLNGDTCNDLLVMIALISSCQVPHPLRASVEHRPEGVSVISISIISTSISISINIRTLNIFLFFKQVGRRGSSRALHLYKQPFPQVSRFVLRKYFHGFLAVKTPRASATGSLWGGSRCSI